MMNKKEDWAYSRHYKHYAEGHIFLGHDVKGGVTIQLTGAASMTQERLDELGKKIVEAVNSQLETSVLQEVL